MLQSSKCILAQGEVASQLGGLQIDNITYNADGGGSLLVCGHTDAAGAIRAVQHCVAVVHQQDGLLAVGEQQGLGGS